MHDKKKEENLLFCSRLIVSLHKKYTDGKLVRQIHDHLWEAFQ